MKYIEVAKMLRVLIIGTCMLFGIPSHAQDHSNPTARTLSQFLWDIGVVDKAAADTARSQGNDPLSLIELPRSANWIRGLTSSEMREVSMVIPGWFVFDSSGYRPETTLSVWCDRGDLYLDTLHVTALKKAQGNATVKWAFDGEPFEETTWIQKSTFILPPDHFSHDSFVRRLENARFLVLQIRGHAGLDPSNPRIRPVDTAIIPVSLTGNNAELSELIQNCSHP